MKKTLLIISSFFFAFLGFADNEQPEKIGDNLDLNGVLELFENSKSIEDFENQLNSENNGVNNLDLNDDGYVDYIRVIDYADGKSHSLTLQVPYSDKEAQDVAVIQLEETGDESVAVQIVGDEDLYGEDYIVEPGDDGSNDVVNAYNWQPVRYIYGPKYTPWVSPWRWNVYPAGYRPWKPIAWNVYHARSHKYHRHYRVVHVYRCPNAHKHYHAHRAHSPAFHVVHPHHKSVVKGPNGVHKAPVKKNPKHKKQPVKKSSPQRKMSGKPTKRPGAIKK